MVFGRGKGRRAQDDAATRGSASDATLERGAVDDLDGDVDSADLNTELGSSAAAGGQSAANPAEALLDVATERRRPFDSSEAPDDADSVMPRIDLGCLRVPVLPETEVRVEMNDQQQAIAVTVIHDASAVQVLAFAAPRGEGIWDDVRAEIAGSIASEGGRVEDAAGIFGPELRAHVRGEVQPGVMGEQPIRFVGFDGPRWFLRAAFSGKAADPGKASVLESVLTSIVVVRGNDPMAPRDPLPLRLPRDVAAAANPPSADVEGAATIAPPVRGPEITETR